MKYTKSIGTRDILPEEAVVWEYVHHILREVSSLYGYGEIRTPAFENAEVFIHSVGETSDIVTKEMYLFADKGDRQLVLKPEGTASIVRAYIENHFHVKPKPVKLYYIDTFHRYERPQKGRFREFHQYGMELLGSRDPASDAEVIHLCFFLLKKLGFKELVLDLNSIGCNDCRPVYRNQLVHFLHHVEEQLCEECRKRIEKNPLRVLDCKNSFCQEGIKDAPLIDQHLCDACNKHHQKLLLLLNDLQVPYRKNPLLVRGLDYYERTVFEVLSSDLGSQNALLGGGRYDGLAEIMGGSPTPAIGFAMGLERLIMILQQLSLLPPMRSLCPVCYLAHEGSDTLSYAFKISSLLRENGIVTEMDLESKGIKKGLETAIKKNSQFAILVGTHEMEDESITIKILQNRTQETCPKENLPDLIKKYLEVIP